MTYVLYHAHCWDGFCAAWLIRRMEPDAEFIPVQYGQDPPECAFDRDSTLYILDFSYPRNVMFKLAALRHQPVIVLDHHKTAQSALEGLEIELASNNCGDALTVVFDMNKSGGRLAWEYLWDHKYNQYSSLYTPGVETCTRDYPPWLVRYTEDRDLWRWAIRGSREVTSALRTYPLDFEFWNTLDGDDTALCRLLREGLTITRYEKTIVADHVQRAREIEMDGHQILATNATVLFSDIAGELAKGRPFGACYFDRQDGKRQWSLRSTDEGVDVSAIAKSHGGGGHRNAAGFEEDSV